MEGYTLIMEATIYNYTPIQASVVALHDQYRTALMNARYYARLLHWFKVSNLTADIVVALAASAAFVSLAVWNDDGDMEETEVAEAAHRLREEQAQQDRQRPTDLTFVLYNSGWVNCATNQQFYAYPVRPKPHHERWMAEFERFRFHELVGQALGSTE